MKLKFIDTIQTAFDDAHLLEADISELNLAVFSDHHRGTGDRADDHRFASATYEKALSHYYGQGSSLVLLGDVEEFWENRASEVMSRYKDITGYELKFLEQNRYLRIWGNHDSDWKNKAFRKKYLGTDHPAYESVRIRVSDGERILGQLFLIHGHQGTIFSDEYAQISKFFVRYFWRFFQRIFNKPLSTAATSTWMRSAHDKRYYQWARKHNHDVIAVTGHTHEPVFNSFTYADRLRVDIHRLEEKERLGGLTANEARLLDEVRERSEALKKHDATLLNPEGRAVPCYFNSGCCSFADGKITGLEVMDEEIRLVKWTPEGERKVIQKERLRRIFDLLSLDAQLDSR